MKSKNIKPWIGILVLLLSGISACTAKWDPADWAETHARIEAIESMENGTFGFTLVYAIPESTAVNAEGERIAGPISQLYLAQAKAPIPGQRIRLRYLRHEPVIYELMEPIRYQGE